MSSPQKKLPKIGPIKPLTPEMTKFFEEQINVFEKKPEKKRSYKKKEYSYFYHYSYQVPPTFNYYSRNPAPNSVLEKYGITNVTEWKNWLRKNHPDKSSDVNATARTQEVISAGKLAGF